MNDIKPKLTILEKLGIDIGNKYSNSGDVNKTRLGKNSNFQQNNITVIGVPTEIAIKLYDSLDERVKNLNQLLKKIIFQFFHKILRVSSIMRTLRNLYTMV